MEKQGSSDRFGDPVRACLVVGGKGITKRENMRECYRMSQLLKKKYPVSVGLPIRVLGRIRWGKRIPRTVSISNLAVIISLGRADVRPMALRPRLSTSLPLLIDSSYGFIIKWPHNSVHMTLVLFS